ncbi:hypothetical protein [uncultured Clostridium sp.]|uniref:hypothetical protein n=1 Tax=uncultured Clostridium sp. TaxID=59620 RepID=UPI00261721CB|nr:hypothetical protein [uncultured Clostridium sp.]
MKKMDIENWDYKYHNNPMIDIRKELTDNQLEIIKKLGIEVKDKIYTEYDYECLKGALSEYIQDDEEEYTPKSLDEKNVDKEEFEELIKRIDEIDENM